MVLTALIHTITGMRVRKINTPIKVQVGQAFSVLNFGSTMMTQHTPLLLHVINKIENNIHANPIIENLQTLIIIFYISIYGIRKNPQTV